MLGIGAVGQYAIAQLPAGYGTPWNTYGFLLGMSAVCHVPVASFAPHFIAAPPVTGGAPQRTLVGTGV